MSHSVTIRTQTVTTTNRSAIIVNSGYLKTWSGILKTLQLILGIICVGLIGHQFNANNYYKTTAELFFLLMVTTFMIATFILLLSCLASMSTESIIAKTIYELIYHAIAFGLLLAASTTLLVHATNYYNRRSSEYELMIGAAVCGLVNAVLYLLSTIIALRRYRGL